MRLTWSSLSSLLILSVCTACEVHIGTGDFDASFWDDWDWQSERDRNIIWRVFTLPGPKSPHWEEFARMCLAQFRAEYGRFIGDPWWTKQIADLSEASPEFRNLWARPDVLNALQGRKSIDHPRVGELAFEFLWLQEINSPDLRLFVYTPRNQATADKIAQLMALEPLSETVPSAAG